MPPAPRAARQDALQALGERTFDVLVVGAGITGAGIALDLTLRGLSVALVDRGDVAGATSSASSRLVHGGLRYLEQLAFGLVRESCRERALLLENARGLVWPERFVFPVRRGDRVGPLKLAAGLWLYAALAVPRGLGRPRFLGRAAALAALPGIGQGTFRAAGTYLDAATDDARLALAVVLAALERGALIATRVEIERLGNGASGIEAAAVDRVAGGRLALRARAAVLAGGPFTDELRRRADLAPGWIAPTRGAHVLVPRERLPTDGAVIFPSHLDGRVMFALPWARHSVLGTTDLDADPARPAAATRREVRYLLDSANGLLPGAALGEGDVVATYAGLRPLLREAGKSPSARSREERIERAGSIFTIAGGKLTGYRAMAERIGARVAAALGRGDASPNSPTRRHPLHGALAAPAPPPPWTRNGAAVTREDVLRARYGACAAAVAARCRGAEGGLEPVDADTLLGEVDHAVEGELALAPSDFLLRRTAAGYCDAASGRRAAEVVAERMAALLGWGAPERAAAAADWATAEARMHGWRQEAAP